MADQLLKIFFEHFPESLSNSLKQVFNFSMVEVGGWSWVELNWVG